MIWKPTSHIFRQATRQHAEASAIPSKGPTGNGLEPSRPVAPPAHLPDQPQSDSEPAAMICPLRLLKTAPVPLRFNLTHPTALSPSTAQAALRSNVIRSLTQQPRLCRAARETSSSCVQAAARPFEDEPCSVSVSDSTPTASTQAGATESGKTRRIWRVPCSGKRMRGSPSSPSQRSRGTVGLLRPVRPRSAAWLS